jgi:prenyl protein peptidase
MTAALLLVLYALFYFLPFYASSTTRPSPVLSRDAPSVIRARVRSVVISCSFCVATTSFVLVTSAGASASDVLHLLGLWPLGLTEALRALLLTATLFLGPLFSYLVVDSGWKEWLRLEPLQAAWQDWTTWRNTVAVCLKNRPLFSCSEFAEPSN